MRSQYDSELQAVDLREPLSTITCNSAHSCQSASGRCVSCSAGSSWTLGKMGAVARVSSRSDLIRRVNTESFSPVLLETVSSGRGERTIRADATGARTVQTRVQG